MVKMQTRFMRDEVLSGQYKLPADLQFAENFNYTAAIHRSEGDQWKWYFEISAAELESLLSPHTASLNWRAKCEQLEQELSTNLRKLEEQKSAINGVMEKYKLLLKNVEEHYVEKPGAKSAKNYFEVARERGTDLKSKPLSGGRSRLPGK